MMFARYRRLGVNPSAYDAPPLTDKKGVFRDNTQTYLRNNKRTWVRLRDTHT